MQFTMLSTQKVPVIGAPAITLDPLVLSAATLSNVIYSSSDPSKFTVDIDPNTPNGAIVTGVAAGEAILNESALATEPDGTTIETIVGQVTITITAATPPPPPVATAISFTFGTPA